MAGDEYWDESEVSVRYGEGYGKGIELEKIPLCEWCGVETQNLGTAAVLERGLEHVSRRDGGLTRQRLDRVEEGDGVGFDGSKDRIWGRRKASNACFESVSMLSRSVT